MTRTHTTRYVTLLSVVLALALTAALAACGSEEPSGVTGPGRTASAPTETPASPARTPTTPGSGAAPTATDAPGAAATRPPLPTLGPTSAKTDREALVALYNATDGENWDESNSWLSDAPLGLGWKGVTTNNDGRVTKPWDSSRYNGLSGRYRRSWAASPAWAGWILARERGEIPAELGSLSNLTRWSSASTT